MRHRHNPNPAPWPWKLSILQSAQNPGDFLRIQRNSCRRSFGAPQFDVLEVGAQYIVIMRIRHQEGIMRSEEHTSELQSLMRISYAVFCLKKKINTTYCVK